MKIMVKVSDISNEVRPMAVAEPWLDCLLQEFFNQVFTLFFSDPKIHIPTQNPDRKAILVVFQMLRSVNNGLVETCG